MGGIGLAIFVTLAGVFGFIADAWTEIKNTNRKSWFSSDMRIKW